MTWNANRKILGARPTLAQVLRSIPLSDKQIARRVGRSPGTVWNWRNERTEPSASDAFTLAREFEECWEAVRTSCGRVETASEARRVLDEFAERLERLRKSL